MDRIRFQVTENNGQKIVEEIHKIVVHTFSVSDVEDPDLYAAQPLYDWEHSEAGKFVMKNAIGQPTWHRTPDILTMGNKYAIIAELEKKKLSEYYLKFGKINA